MFNITETKERFNQELSNINNDAMIESDGILDKANYAIRKDILSTITKAYQKNEIDFRLDGNIEA